MPLIVRMRLPHPVPSYPPMMLFLDDQRECPGGLTLCRTAEEAILLIDTGNVSHISFDHDLGGRLNGYDVALHIENRVAEGISPVQNGCPLR